MGEISRFYGIVIRMFGGEKHHPHFHAIYGDYSALIDIRSLRIVAGGLPGRASRLIMEWASEHQVELLRNWDFCKTEEFPARSRPWSEPVNIVRVVEVEPLTGYRLRLRFNDGAEGTVDVSAVVAFENDYARLRDPAFFRQVAVEKDFGAIVWPGDLDIDPYTLYVEATGREIRLDDGTTIRPAGVSAS